MKKLKINYLFIGILTLLLAAALWPSIPWFGKTENHIAAIQARGVLRVSTIDSPLTYSVINGKKYGLDYELAQQFANYLGVKLKVTVRQNISQLFDDLDNGNADLLAAGLVYDSARVKNYQPAPCIIQFRNSSSTGSDNIAHVRWRPLTRISLPLRQGTSWSMIYSV